MRALGIFFPIVLVIFSVTVLHAATIRVPADYGRIQVALYFAEEGDTVLVADGTYTGLGNRDIDFLGKAIVVMSENGPENCIIDCEGSGSHQHRGFYFHNGEDSGSVLKGITIQGGYSQGSEVQSYGGAILCESSSPTLTGLIIKENTFFGSDWPDGGGGIYCYESSALIERNTIMDNRVYGLNSCGGGVACYASSPVIRDNIIVRNTVDWGDGGGIWCWASSPVIEENRIQGNATYWKGGGIASKYYSASLIRNNIVSNNTAEEGGGVYGDWSEYFSSLRIINNTIYKNRADFGGGVMTKRAYAEIFGNTITDNYAWEAGGGICCYELSTHYVSNTILWNNDGNEIYLGWYNFPSFLTIEYSDVESGQNSVDMDDASTLIWGEGMIDADPMFVHHEKDDVRLLWGSPCIDTGHPNSQDPDGTRGDMGAHYFNQDKYLTLYVTPDDSVVYRFGNLGVTYSIINRRDWTQPFWALSVVTSPGGVIVPVLGPEKYNFPANSTVQIHTSLHIPTNAPLGAYTYRSGLGLPPGSIFDEDAFIFTVYPLQ